MARGPLLFLAAAIAALAGLGYLVASGAAGSDYPAVGLDPSRPRPQGDFYRSALPEPPSLNPFTTRSAVATSYVLPYTHDRLVDLDPRSGEPRPALAESWQASEDGKQWHFRLREGLRFADGSPVTADDLRFTLEIARHPVLSAADRSTMSQTLAGLEAAAVVGDRELHLTLEQPLATALLTLGTELRVVQRAWFVDAVRALDPEAEPMSERFVQRLIEIREPGPGAGPYHLADWLPSHLDLVQNPWCWRREAQPECWNLAGMRLRFLVDETAKVAALHQQEIDWFVAGSGDLRGLIDNDPELRRNYRVLGYDKASIGSYYVMWNHRRGALGRAEVRRALSMLFDRATLVDQVLGGRATASHGWFDPGSPESPTELEPIPFSVQRARQALLAAGIDPAAEPLRIELLCAAEVPTMRRIAEVALPAFRAAGVELVAQTLDYRTVYNRETEGDFDALILLHYRDAANDPYDFFASDQNMMGWQNESADALLAEARLEFDAGKRQALYQDFERLLRREEPVTFLAHPLVEVALHRRFQDSAPGPLGLIPERWWVLRAEQLVRVE